MAGPPTEARSDRTGRKQRSPPGRRGAAAARPRRGRPLRRARRMPRYAGAGEQRRPRGCRHRAGPGPRRSSPRHGLPGRAARPAPGTPAGAPSRPAARPAGSGPAPRRRRPGGEPDRAGFPLPRTVMTPWRQAMSSSSSPAASPARSARRSSSAIIGSFRSPPGAARTNARNSATCTGLRPFGTAGPAGAANDPTNPASGTAVRPSSQVKRSSARTAFARTCADRGRSPAAPAVARAETPAAVRTPSCPAQASANGRAW